MSAIALPTKREKEALLARMDKCHSEIGRKLAFMSYIGEALARQNIPPPVIVGGTAVELYTSGQYATPDIDILGPRAEIMALLEALGFEKQKGDPGGIRWSEEFGVIIDWQGGACDGRALNLEDAKGELLIRAIGINELIIDRLCASKFWQHGESLEWARILLAIGLNNGFALDLDYLKELSRKEDVYDALESLLAAQNHRPTPETGEISPC